MILYQLQEKIILMVKAQQVQRISIPQDDATTIQHSSQSRGAKAKFQQHRQSVQKAIQTCYYQPSDFSNQQLQYINQTLREESIAHLLSNYTKILRIRPLLRHWNMYEFQLKQQAIVFLNLVYLKAEIFGSVFYHIFDGLEELVQKLKAKLDLKQSLKDKLKRYKQQTQSKFSGDKYLKMQKKLILDIQNILQVKLHPLDKILQQILEQVSNSQQWEGQLVEKLFRTMMQHKDFHQLQFYWLIIFEKVELQSKTKSRAMLKLTQANFLKNIQFQKMMNINCLGCMRFAYEDIVIQGITNKTPVAVFPNIHKIRQMQTQVKEKICAFMNSGGGVILFNCIKQLFNIKVKGCRISEKQKEAYEQIIISFLASFYPRLTLNDNIVISFVPIVSMDENNYGLQDLQMTTYKGEEGLIKQGQTYYQRQYIQGFYVCRIKISPFKDKKPSIWVQNQGNYQNPHLNQKYQSNLEEPIKNLRKVIKRNILQTNQQFSQPHEIIQKSYTCFDHQCLSPEPGIIVSNSNKMIQGVQACEKGNLENSFNYMSLLIVNIKYLQLVKQKLKRYGSDVFIDRPFASYKFKKAAHTAVLYHNIKFETILKELSFNRQFQFQGKRLLVINVTPFLKLSSRQVNNLFSQSEFDNTQSWLRTQFPDQKLKIWEFRNEQNIVEYYLSTSQRLSILFLYFLLGHYKEAVSFKCPSGLDKMSLEEKAASFKEITYRFTHSQSEITECKKASQRDQNRLSKRSDQQQIILKSIIQQMCQAEIKQEQMMRWQPSNLQTVNI